MTSQVYFFRQAMLTYDMNYMESPENAKFSGNSGRNMENGLIYFRDMYVCMYIIVGVRHTRPVKTNSDYKNKQKSKTPYNKLLERITL